MISSFEGGTVTGQYRIVANVGFVGGIDAYNAATFHIVAILTAGGMTQSYPVNVMLTVVPGVTKRTVNRPPPSCPRMRTGSRAPATSYWSAKGRVSQHTSSMGATVITGRTRSYRMVLASVHPTPPVPIRPDTSRNASRVRRYSK